ncbi:MAG TPA: hypothetical protein VF456_16405 [Vicinamibacterales bacterium]
MFLASVLLFAISLVLLRIYYLRESALEHAVRAEVLETVGTPQEPAESSSELGLIAAALAPINRDHTLGSGVSDERCQKDDVLCRAVRSLEADFGTEIKRQLNSIADSEAMTALGNAAELNYPVLNVSRPEFGTSTACSNADRFDADSTAVIVPAQLRDTETPGRLPKRVALAVALSAGLEHSIKGVRAEFEKEDVFSQIVQVYFISPDSVLRLWSNQYADVCDTFDQHRLWASKSYVTYFWSHPDKTSYSTEAYLDYGGNGLVQTRCIGIEAPRPHDSAFDHGQLFGVLCTDLRLSNAHLDKLRRQLFFETALVTFSPATELPFVRADATLPGSVTASPGSSQPAPDTVLAAIGGRVTSPADVATIVAELSGRLTRTDTDRAIDMQPIHIHDADIEAAVRTRIRGSDSSALGRGPTRLPFAEHDAFLLPVGRAPLAECGNERDLPCQRAIFFYPRNPVLPDEIKWSGASGYVILGMSVVLGVIGIRLRPRSEELRERLSLLRNLQVGIIRADNDSFIVEANDRAEELFQRRLPKYRPQDSSIFGRTLTWAARRLLHRPPPPSIKLRFFDFIDGCLQEDPEQRDGEMRYVPIKESDILGLRNSGRSSSYYARLRRRMGERQPAVGRWLKVSATPMMLARHDHVKGAQLSHVFATVCEVDDDVAAELDVELDAANPRTPTQGN